MLFGLIIDYFCRILLTGLAVGVAAFVVSCAVILIGEKMKWW